MVCFLFRHPEEVLKLTKKNEMLLVVFLKIWSDKIHSIQSFDKLNKILYIIQSILFKFDNTFCEVGKTPQKNSFYTVHNLFDNFL